VRNSELRVREITLGDDFFILAFFTETRVNLMTFGYYYERLEQRIISICCVNSVTASFSFAGRQICSAIKINIQARLNLHMEAENSGMQIPHVQKA
jgi:hypothetical protein